MVKTPPAESSHCHSWSSLGRSCRSALCAIWVVTVSLKRRDLERSLEASGAELTELAAARQLRRAVSPQKRRFISIICTATEEVATRLPSRRESNVAAKAALTKSPLTDLYNVAFKPPLTACYPLPTLTIVEEQWRDVGLVEKNEDDSKDKKKKLTEGRAGSVETKRL